MSPSASEIEALDREDPLAHARSRFTLDERLIYLDGNSLGALPAATPDHLGRVVAEEWGRGLVGSWNDAGWYELPLRLGDRLAELLGAGPGQTAVCDSTSINLFKVLAAAFGLQPDRSVLLMDEGEFPTNLYIAEGARSAFGRPLERRLLDRDSDPIDSLDETIAVVALSQVNYRTGAQRDVRAITEAAHAAGVLVVWDLCHSAGVVPLALDDWGVDFAVGCTYKFLNGGPGAPAWVYVAQRHLGSVGHPLSGWMGHAAPFDFDSGYRPDPGIRRFLSGTPPILSLQAVACGLDCFEGIEIEAIRAKATALTDLFIERVESSPAGRCLELVSPRDNQRRGAQVSFRFAHGYELVRALVERGVLGDYREPGIMRFGFAPLYLSYAEVARAADLLVACLEQEAWNQPRLRKREPVT